MSRCPPLTSPSWGGEAKQKRGNFSYRDLTRNCCLMNHLQISLAEPSARKCSPVAPLQPRQRTSPSYWELPHMLGPRTCQKSQISLQGTYTSPREGTAQSVIQNCVLSVVRIRWNSFQGNTRPATSGQLFCCFSLLAAVSEQIATNEATKIRTKPHDTTLNRISRSASDQMSFKPGNVLLIRLPAKVAIVKQGVFTARARRGAGRSVTLGPIQAVSNTNAKLGNLPPGVM